MHKSLLIAAPSLLLLAQIAPAQTSIDPARLTETVKTLASDEFEGRGPGTTGEHKTIGYLIARFEALGLEPGGKDEQWTQKVPLLRTRLGTPATFGFDGAAGKQPLAFGKDIYVTSLQPRDMATIAAAPVVFVGYGVNAPERRWDDFKGVDLKGKVVIFLINDPDFVADKKEPVAGKFGGRTMTYYGRWSYKLEEAARRGAIGALIVHDTDGAGYGWNVVISGAGENYDIVRPENQLTSLALQGWLSGEAATTLFTRSGLDLAKLRIAARTAGFKPVELKGVTFNASAPVAHEIVQSQNVLARIKGSSRPDETILYGAHWDAYGEGPPDANGKIYRAGSNDDALGIAGMIEIARSFKSAPPPARSIVFAAWTAEERGLLGSESYAANPLYPHEKTVAVLDLDILQTAGKARDVILVGKGQNGLEDDLTRLAAKQGRTVTPESLPERGLFYRADHFPFAKRGVPTLLMMGIAGAPDLVKGGREAGQKWVDDYTGKCYHQACDAWSMDWDLTGAVEDVTLLRDLGDELARSDRWPSWKPGSEFLAVRASSENLRR